MQKNLSPLFHFQKILLPVALFSQINTDLGNTSGGISESYVALKHNVNSIPFIEKIANTLRSRGLYGFRSSESMHPNEGYHAYLLQGGKASSEGTSIKMYVPPQE